MASVGRISPLLLAAALAGCSAGGLVEGVGVMDSYRMAERGPIATPVPHRPVAYWASLKAAAHAPGSRDVLLYVEVASYTPLDVDPEMPYGVEVPTMEPPAYGTAHDPCLDRYLLRGRRLKYRGTHVPASGDTPAHVDTSIPGGRLEIVFDATPARGLSDLAVGKWVSFDGVIEPREAWMKWFPKELNYQTWQLVVTLPSGETMDIGDRFLVESRDFRKCLAILRQKRSVRVRVVGEVWDAASIHALAEKNKFVGSQRDVRGDRFVAVEQLEILGDQPAAEVKP